MSTNLKTGGFANSIPARAGIGLRDPHIREILDTQPDIGWFEVHSENYFGEGGLPLHQLEQIRTNYPVSVHGVGLSLGSTDPLSVEHLKNLAKLVNRIEPGLISEHLSWSSVGGQYLNDLLPLPYTEEALAHVVSRVQQVQEFLQRQILVENVSSYLQYTDSNIPEWEFITEVAKRSGSGILLDVNNVFVSASNHGFDARTYLRAIPKNLVGEIHLAGFTEREFDNGRILIDTHSQPVSAAVWALYREIISRFRLVPTLIEWDIDLPTLDVLLGEAHKADAVLMAETHELVA